MDWFKHDTSSIDDPDMMEAELLFGDAGYSVFFKILEIYGKEFSHLSDGKLNISCTILRRKLNKSWTKVERILNFYQTKKRIFFTTDGDRVSIEVPKFIKISSNWTVRQLPKSNNEPTEETTEAPTAKEEEEEEEVEEDNIYMSIPLIDKTNYDLTEKEKKELEFLYPYINIEQGLKDILGWNKSNPTKRKTRRGFMKHVNTWLRTKNDKNMPKPEEKQKPILCRCGCGRPLGGSAIDGYRSECYDD